MLPLNWVDKEYFKKLYYYKLNIIKGKSGGCYVKLKDIL